ncbi:MAG: efflux RND transporter periplasmic adaptor subunit [Rikenellaceae bacterium]
MKRLFISALALATLVGCAEQQTKSSEAAVVDPAQSKILTKSTVAKGANIELIELFTSEVEAYKENDITPAVSGVRVDKILVDVGDNVKKGQLLATLDPTLYNQQMLAVNTLQNDYNRLLPVFEAGGISAQTLDQTKSSLDVQREVAENIKKNIELLSPIDGVITARNTEDGNLFNNAAILHVAQMDRVKVKVNIPEQFVPNVKLGMPVAVLSEVYPGKEFSGKVSLIYPALDPTTHTFTVEVTVPNSSMELRPGIYARARFNMGSKAGILVPDVAVQKQFGSSEHFVYVYKDGKAVRRIVKKGRQVDSDIDILSGVKAGDQVLVTAFSRLSDGAEVTLKM